MPLRILGPREVPYELLDLVCVCSEPGLGTRHPRNKWQLACSNCLKYFRYLVRLECVGCGQPYVKAFYHQLSCYDIHRCWNCLEVATERDCNDPWCTNNPYHPPREMLDPLTLVMKGKADLSIITEIELDI